MVGMRYESQATFASSFDPSLMLCMIVVRVQMKLGLAEKEEGEI